MAESEREAFLSAFSTGRPETLVGFAVMGGLFGEGIDLVGNALVGAVVVGVGLPQICFERDLICDFFERQKGTGFDHAYLYPGLVRVLQAVGRVIRSETDRGVALLIDVRFSQGRYRRLFPTWWQPRQARSDEQIATELQQFWRRAEIPIVEGSTDTPIEPDSISMPNSRRSGGNGSLTL